MPNPSTLALEEDGPTTTENIDPIEEELNQLHAYLDACGVPKETLNPHDGRPAGWRTRGLASARVRALMDANEQLRDENASLRDIMFGMHRLTGWCAYSHTLLKMGVELDIADTKGKP